MPVTPITPAQIDEVGKGASASPSGHSRAEPSGLGPTAECPSRGQPDIESLIAIWSMRPPPLSVAGQCWEDGARQGWAWALERAALGTEARSAETGTGSVEDEGPACKATPSISPSPRKGQEENPCPMTVEEAREVLDNNIPRYTDPESYLTGLRWRADDAMEPYVATALNALASRIEAALRTLSDQDTGEVRT